MTEQKNPIEELFTTSGPFDEKEAVRILKPLISIREKTFEIYFINENMKIDNKILAFAITKKLLYSAGHCEEGHVSAVEVYKKTGIPKGSIDVSFKNLKQGKFLVGKGQAYEIPNYRIPQVLEKLDKVE